MSSVPYRGVNGRYDREDDEQPVRAANTMVAKYRGRCATTGQPIEPGDTIQAVGYRRYVLVSHKLVSDVFNIGGVEYYRNKNGRCEDAPCCGCCTI